MILTTKQINGIDLHDQSRGWFLNRDGTSPGIARSVRQDALVVGGRHGDVPKGSLPVYDSATVNLSFVLDATSQYELASRYRDLFGVFSQPSLVYQEVIFDGPATEVHEAPAVLVSMGEPSDFLPGRYVSVSMILSLLDPFLRDVAGSTTGILAAGTHPLSLFAGTAPITDVVVRFGPSVSDPAVTDVASGTGLTWRGAVTSGTYVYADPSTMRAWRSTSASQWTQGSATSVSGSLDYPGPGRLQVWPTTTITGGVLSRVPTVLTTGPTMIRGRRAWL